MRRIIRKIGRDLKKCIKMRLFIKKNIDGSENRVEIITHNFRRIDIRVKGNKNHIFIGSETQIRNSTFRIYGDNNRVCVGSDNALFGAEFFVIGSDLEIAIGNKNRFEGTGNVFSVSERGTKITVGNENLFAWGHHNLTAEEGTTLSVGNGCLFSNDVYVRTGDSHSVLDATTGERLNWGKSVSIGNRVWIAPCVRILKGACLKDDSVVGTGAIVTRSFESGNVVIAGNPATVVKEGIVWKA